MTDTVYDLSFSAFCISLIAENCIINICKHYFLFIWYGYLFYICNMKKQIEDLMRHLGLTATRFASEIGVQRSSISHILSGRNQPSYEFILKTIERYPEIDVEWLITGKGQMLRTKLKSPWSSGEQNTPLTKRLKDDVPQKISINMTQGAANTLTEKQDDMITGNDTKDMSDSGNQISNKVTYVNIPEQVILLHANGTFKVYNPL